MATLDAYKYKVYSGDGQTFLRTGILVVPRCVADGAGARATAVDANGTFAEICNTLSGSGGKIFWNTDITMLSAGTNVNMYAPSIGMSRVMNLSLFFGPSPTAGQSVRMVFNNNSYIKLSIYSISAAELYVTQEFFTSSDTQVGSAIYLYFTITEPTRSYWAQPFPFIYKNADGTLTDYTIRGVGNYYYTTYPFRGNVSHAKININAYNTSNPYCGISWATNYGLPFSSFNAQTWYTGIEPFDMDDPYPGIPSSLPSGPAEADGVPETDAISFPDIPSVSPLNTNFVTLYRPTLTQLQSLASYMWSNSFNIDHLKRMFADPMDCILGLMMLPVNFTEGTNQAVIVGNLSTGVEMRTCPDQWTYKNMGTVHVPLSYGNYLDYSPYTKASLFLPYIGIVELSTDDIAGKDVSIRYNVDGLTGACVAFVKCDSDVLYQFAGQCGYAIPFSSVDYRNSYSAAFSIAATLGGTIMSGGITAATVLKDGTSSANNVMNSKPVIHRSGSIGGGSGIMGGQTPYLILEIPNACKPDKQYHYTGYPSFVTVKLSDLSGYTEFEQIILDGIPCTAEERRMIEALCKGGIYL